MKVVVFKMAQSLECINEGFFLSILNHLFQAYTLLCIFFLFQEEMDNLQVNRFVLKPIFFRLNGITWKIFSLSCNRKVAFLLRCHVIGKLLFVAFNRRAEISKNRASSADRASPADVIGH